MIGISQDEYQASTSKLDPRAQFNVQRIKHAKVPRTNRYIFTKTNNVNLTMAESLVVIKCSSKSECQKTKLPGIDSIDVDPIITHEIK